MNSEETRDGVPLFYTKEIDVRVPEKKISREALVHDYAPGLAVVMHEFGEFVVTHVPSGKRLGATYERCGSSMRELSGWALIAKACDFSWDKISGDDPELLKELFDRIKSLPVPFDGATTTSKDGTVPMSIGQWADRVKNPFLNSEFPWEEEHPHTTTFKRLAQIKPGAQASEVE